MVVSAQLRPRLGAMATRRHEDLVGSQKLADATGRSREEWHSLLDAAGASAWDHGRIARWLIEEQGMDGWWAQGVTVGYEQARGMRLPGQRPDGTFDANASKTIARGAADVFPLVADDEAAAAWVGEGWRVRSASAPKRARLEGPDGERVLVEVTAVSADKVRVAVQHTKLAGPDDVAEAKAFWRAALERLAGSAV